MPIAIATDDLEAARYYADDQLAIGKQLAPFDRERPWWTHLLANAYCSLGTIARMEGDPDAALRHHEAAIGVLSVAFARGSKDLNLTRDNGSIRTELARSLLAAGRPKQALLHANLAVEVFRAMPQNILARTMLAEATLVQGEALAAQGRYATANEAWAEAVRLCEAIPARPRAPRTIDTQARALLHLGRLDQATPLVEQLAALGYRNREFVALCKEKGAFINQPKKEVS